MQYPPNHCNIPNTRKARIHIHIHIEFIHTIPFRPAASNIKVTGHRNPAKDVKKSETRIPEKTIIKIKHFWKAVPCPIPDRRACHDEIMSDDFERKF